MADNGDRPAFPQSERTELGFAPGLTVREHAAIQLRVPDSGQQWLDDMIREARRMDAVERVVAAFAMNKAGMEAIGQVAKANRVEPEAAAVIAAETFADAMLAARAKAEG